MVYAASVVFARLSPSRHVNTGPSTPSSESGMQGHRPMSGVGEVTIQPGLLRTTQTLRGGFSGSQALLNRCCPPRANMNADPM